MSLAFLKYKDGSYTVRRIDDSKLHSIMNTLQDNTVNSIAVIESFSEAPTNFDITDYMGIILTEVKEYDKVTTELFKPNSILCCELVDRTLNISKQELLDKLKDLENTAHESIFNYNYDVVKSTLLSGYINSYNEVSLNLHSQIIHFAQAMLSKFAKHVNAYVFRVTVKQILNTLNKYKDDERVYQQYLMLSTLVNYININTIN